MWNQQSTPQQRTHELHHHIATIVCLYLTDPAHPYLRDLLRTLDRMDSSDGEMMHRAITYDDHGGPLNLMLQLRQRDAVFLTGAWGGDANTRSAAA